MIFSPSSLKKCSLYPNISETAVRAEQGWAADITVKMCGVKPRRRNRRQRTASSILSHTLQTVLVGGLGAGSGVAWLSSEAEGNGESFFLVCLCPSEACFTLSVCIQLFPRSGNCPSFSMLVRPPSTASVLGFQVNAKNDF